MKIKLTKKDIIQYANNIFLIIFGTALLAFGTAVFIVPFDLVTGGVSGIAIVVEKVLPFNISIDAYIAIFTWVLFFMGLIFLGKNFAAKTLLSTIFYPILFTLFYSLVDPNVLAGLFVLQNSTYNEIAVLLAAIFGGAFIGAGCAITFVAGGSTGGVDIIAFLLIKVFKKIKSSYLIFLIDAIIVVLGVFIIHDIVLSMLGILSAFICSAMVDKIFLGSSTAYVAQIISEKSDDICKGVIEIMDRTATVVDVVGAYSKASKKMVIVAFSLQEYSELMKIINQTDPGAFVMISRVHENHGEGWTHDKT